MKNPSRTPQYKKYVVTSINAAKLAIEMFNRVEGDHNRQAAIIFCAQAWELLGKGLWIKSKKNIFQKDGRSYSAEKIVNGLRHQLNKLSDGENKTVQQVISLRNEAVHDVIPFVDDEIILHLLYYSMKLFNEVLRNNFKSYSKDFDKNFLSISFKELTHYSHRVQNILKKSKQFNSKENKILYLLDRACEYASDPQQDLMKSPSEWQKKIKKLPKKARVARHLPIYKYINDQENVRFVPVETKRGHKAVITTGKTNKEYASIVVQKTDPDKDYPYFTIDIANSLGKNQNFIAATCKKLGLRGNENYCLLQKQSKSGGRLPKYNNKTINYLKEHFKNNPDYSPYR